MGHEFEDDSSGQFLLGVSDVVAVRSGLGLQSPEGLPGLDVQYGSLI